jgi:hypothetical protein
MTARPALADITTSPGTTPNHFARHDANHHRG